MPSVPDEAQTPASDIRERVEGALDRSTTEWQRPDTGLSAAERYSVQVADGTRVFIKAATDEQTERWLRTEYLALHNVPERFSPGIIAWLDEPGSFPILLVEDLSQAHWPASHQGVNWRDGDIDRVLAAAADLSRVQAPSVFTPTPRHEMLWPALERDAFLDLGLCSAAWFDDAAPVLADAEARRDDSGDRIVHGDLRSDNICIDGDRVVFVDWSHVSRGHDLHDLAGLLPTLHLEGGPEPFSVMPDGGPWAAAGCASLVRRVFDESGLPPWLVQVFITLAAIDLSWAASCLGLSQPDGRDRKSI